MLYQLHIFSIGAITVSILGMYMLSLEKFVCDIIVCVGLLLSPLQIDPLNKIRESPSSTRVGQHVDPSIRPTVHLPKTVKVFLLHFLFADTFVKNRMFGSFAILSR